MHKIGLITFFSLLVLLSYNSYVFSHVGESHRDKGLHFSHPLISESPSPDTKIRLDYFFLDEIEEEGEEGEEESSFNEHTIRLEAEYAFNRNLSIEVDVPYTFIDPEEGSNQDHFNNIEMGLKLASFIFEASIQLPVIQDLNGNQVEKDFVLTAGFRVNLP